MKRQIVSEIPEGYRTDFEVALFNTALHRNLQSASGWESFLLVDHDKRAVLASVHFVVKRQVANSPCKAPFGSFEWSDQLHPSKLYDFITSVEARMRKKGVRTIEIKHPPVHLPKHHLIPVFLLNQGYRISTSEVAAYVPVSDQDFAERLHKWPARKLRQSLQAELKFSMLPLDQAESVYNFICNARTDKGYSMSMDKDELLKTIKKCREHFHLFAVFSKREMVAACISIRVTDKVLYNFYMAHSKQTDKLSPVVNLLNGIYDWCKPQGIAWMDLGTSAIEDAPNFPLLEFKLRTGALPVSKFTFVKGLV